MEGVAAASVEGHSGAHDHPHRICGAASAVNAQGGATHPALVAPPPHRGGTIREAAAKEGIFTLEDYLDVTMDEDLN